MKRFIEVVFLASLIMLMGCSDDSKSDNHKYEYKSMSTQELCFANWEHLVSKGEECSADDLTELKNTYVNACLNYYNDLPECKTELFEQSSCAYNLIDNNDNDFSKCKEENQAVMRCDESVLREYENTTPKPATVLMRSDRLDDCSLMCIDITALMLFN